MPPNWQFERIHCPPLPFVFTNTRGPQVPLNIVLLNWAKRLGTKCVADFDHRHLRLLTCSAVS